MKKANQSIKDSIPSSLRKWFLIHFIIDILFALPLIFYPTWLLGLFGLPSSEAVMARLVGAALVGIGGASLFSYSKSKESYDILLTLKLLWSSTAILALVLSLLNGAPASIWLFIFIFVVFFFIWLYYKKNI